MKRMTRSMAVITVIAAGAISAGAQQQPRQGRSERKQQGFNCPTCGRPCAGKAAFQQQRRQGMQAQRGRQFGPQTRGNARYAKPGHPRGKQAAGPSHFQRSPQRTMHFDLDGDGQLSAAERAARKAYVQANRQNGDGPHQQRAPKGPEAE